MSTAKTVVISCAGIGFRFGSGHNKALLDLFGRPLIQWQLELLKDVEDLRIVVGYEARDVMARALEVRRDITFVYNRDYYKTLTGTSFYLGTRDAGEYVVAWDGDLLVHPDDVKICLDYPGEYVGYSDPSSEETVFVKTDDQGDVLRFSREDGDFEWTGPACIRKDKILSSTGAVFNLFEPYLPMKGLKIRAQDIDTSADYAQAVEFVKNW